MGLAELLGVIFGALMPPAIDAVNKAHWPSWAKLGVALASSAVIGTATAWATGDLSTAGGWWQIVTAVFVGSQVAYRTWWHRPRQVETPAADGG